MNVEVAKLVPSDRQAWQELFTGYNTFYERVLPPEAFDRAWDAFMKDDEMHAYGAVVDGKLIGIVHFLTHASTTTADVCYLQDLFTNPAARGSGVGAGLIRAVADWAQQRGCSRVYWNTHETNATARRLYDRVGINQGFIVYRMALPVQ